MSTELLRALIVATPPPPPTEDADELLAAFVAVLAARQELLDRAAPVVGPRTAAAEPLVAELAVRERAWSDALERARDATAAVRRNLSRLRSYATPP